MHKSIAVKCRHDSGRGGVEGVEEVGWTQENKNHNLWSNKKVNLRTSILLVANILQHVDSLI